MLFAYFKNRKKAKEILKKICETDWLTVVGLSSPEIDVFKIGSVPVIEETYVKGIGRWNFYSCKTGTLIVSRKDLVAAIKEQFKIKKIFRLR